MKMKMKMKMISLVGVITLMFCGVAYAHQDEGNLKDTEVNKQVAQLRSVMAKYHDVNEAITDGYVPTTHLVPNMGYHYMKPSLLDGKVDPLTPEVLIYEPRGNGVKLVAVEYISTVPSQLFGKTFDPPGGIPFHSLHA